MHKSKLLVAAAAIFSTFAFAQANAAELTTTVTRQNIQTEVQKADRPVVLLGCTADAAKQLTCGANEDALAQQAVKHPELKFVKVNADDFGLDAGLYVFVPGAGVTYKQPGFDAAKVGDDFYNKRADFAAKESAAAANIKAVKDKVTAAVKPTNDKMADLRKRDDALYEQQAAQVKAVRDAEKADPKVVALMKKAETKAAPFDKRLAALEKQYRKVQAQRQAALAPLSKKMDEARAPYKAQRDKINADLDSAERDLSKEAAAVEKEQDAVRKPFAADLAKAQKALTDLVLQDQPQD